MNKFLLIHGWSSNYYIVIRVMGFGFKHLTITSKHYLLKFFSIFEFILYFPAFMSSITSKLFPPLKGSSPCNIAYKITPVAHTSILPSILYYFDEIKHYGAI